MPFVVRWERGTINRFIYSIAMLAPSGEADPTAPDDSLWNDRLVLSFQGGVAIGHFQGTTSTGAMLPADLLGAGYGVVWSSGTRTSTHYDLQVGGETALMVKERFVERHGEPLYTVAVGGSGGAIQQYVYAQNHPGLIDAGDPPVLLPRHGHPDDPRRRLRAARALLRRHRPGQPEVAGPRGAPADHRAQRHELPEEPVAPARSPSGTGSTSCTPPSGTRSWTATRPRRRRR